MKDTGRALASIVSRRLPRMVEDAASVRLVRARGRPRKDVDLSFQLRGEGVEKPLWVEVKGHPRASAVDDFLSRAQRAAENGAVYLLAAPYLDRAIRRELRSVGVSHADLGGTLYLSAPGLLISVDGAATVARHGTTGGDVNPFADRASLVLRSLLREPGRGWGVRELAAALAISPGLVSRTGEVLVRRGYASSQGGKLVLADAAGALIDWISVRPWKRAGVRSFVAPYEPGELRAMAWETVEKAAPGTAALTQLAALAAYAPHVVGQDQVHLYCDADLAASVGVLVAATLHAEPVRRGGNLHIVRPALRRSAYFDARMIGGVRVVSPLQLFLDLSGYAVRGAEAAEMLLRTTLGPQVGLEREQMARIARVLEGL